MSGDVASRPFVDDGGVHHDDRAMVALYVLVREQGRWWIAAWANTLVKPVSHDPS
jgi:hypothetical protein